MSLVAINIQNTPSLLQRARRSWQWLLAALLVLSATAAISAALTALPKRTGAEPLVWVAPQAIVDQSVAPNNALNAASSAVQTAAVPMSASNITNSAATPAQSKAQSNPASAPLSDRRVFALVDPNGAYAAPAVSALTPLDWVVAAVANAGNESIVVLRFTDGQTQTLKVNDKLPGGAVIKRIEADRLYIILDGERRVLRTYRE